MATMIPADRQACSADLQRELSRDRETIATLTKAQFQAAVDAVDQWASDNAASYNTALPLAARNALTAAQKSRLLRAVVAKRYEKGL
jgi:protein-disulfide isomerase-like protein with CxxC motif